MKHALDLFISVGEISGDNLAVSIVEHLPKDLKIGGIIGPNLRKAKLHEYFPMELFEIHGIKALLKGVFRILLKYGKIKKKILQLNPKVVVFVDNMEFSRLMAASLRKSGYKGKIVQLVCPTVWAYRKGRIKGMVKNLDLILALFPFEVKPFAQTTLSVEFIGHPLVENLSKLQLEQTDLEKPVFALFPGSRKSDIQLNFPLQLRAAKKIKDRYDIAVSVAHPKHLHLIKTIAKNECLDIELVSSENRYKLMKKATFALAKCGTTTFELGLIGTPTIVMYKMSLIDILGAYLTNVALHHYSLTNILLEKRIFPEYVGNYAQEHLISEEVMRFSEQKEMRDEMKVVSKNLMNLFQSKSAAREGAEKIRNLIFIPS